MLRTNIHRNGISDPATFYVTKVGLLIVFEYLYLREKKKRNFELYFANVTKVFSAVRGGQLRLLIGMITVSLLGGSHRHCSLCALAYLIGEESGVCRVLLSRSWHANAPIPGRSEDGLHLEAGPLRTMR